MTSFKSFDMIYLAAENGGKLFQKNTSMIDEKKLKKMKKWLTKTTGHDILYKLLLKRTTQKAL